MRNKFDRSGEAAASGFAAEASFEKSAQSKNMKVTKASRKENMSHIDYFVEYQNKTVSVDVKSRKKIKRSDSAINDEFIWIEFKNVQGKRGWLYGKADFIAFEREDHFLLVKRSLLAKLCEKLVDLSKINENPRFPLYSAYQRRNRNDVLSLIRADDITSNIKHFILEK